MSTEININTNRTEVKLKSGSTTVLVQGGLIKVGESGSGIKLIPFDPSTSAITVDFVADQASTIVTPTQISSLNNEASPTLNFGFESNYESATASDATSGSYSADVSLGGRYVNVYFHNGDFSIADYYGDGVLTGFGGGISTFSGNFYKLDSENDFTNINPVNPSELDFELINNQVLCGDSVLDVDFLVYNRITVIITQDLTLGVSSDVDPLDYSSNLYFTEIPENANDGDILQILDSGVVLGVPVVVDDLLMLTDDKTKATKINQEDLSALELKEDKSNKGIANGYASLDSGGKVPVAQLPSSIMEYKGTWDAATNTPTLANGTGDTGDVYRVSVAGTQFGIDFGVGDYAIYNGSIWEKADTTDSVATVFGRTGNVTSQTGDYSISQITDASTVASTGSFSDLLSQSALFNLVYSAYVIGSNTAILASDTLGQMLGKLQAQINNKEPSITSGSTGEYWSWDKTWRSFATDVLGTVLTGLSTATATAVTAADSNLTAIGKLQGQINALPPSLGGGLTFNQSRWIFNDFDSGINANVALYSGYVVASIGTGTRVGIAGGVGTQGVLRFISAAAANTGFYVSNASAAPNMHIRPLQGSCCLFVAALPSGGSSRLLTIGFDATVNWSVATMPTNSVHAKFTISGSTVSASCRRSVGGTTTTQGSTVLTGDVYYVYLVQYIADDQVRFVIWNLLTNVKVFDETIITGTPTTATGAILFHGVHATGSGTQPLVDIDYIGRGIELPPFFAIPP